MLYYLFMPPDDAYGAFARPDPDTLISFKAYGKMTYATVLVPTISSVEAPVIGEALSQSLAEAPDGFAHLVLDISNVSMVNSMALGVFVSAYTSAMHRGAKFILAGVPDSVLDLLVATKMTSVLRACRNAQELERALAE